MDQKLKELINIQPSDLSKKEDGYYPIFTSYYGNIQRIPKPYKAFCISDVCPDKRMEKIPDIIPGAYLLSYYNRMKNTDSKAAESRFKAIYRTKLQELKGNGKLQEITDMLKRKSQKHPVILFCFEKPEDFCHRHLLAEELNKDFHLDIRELLTQIQIDQAIKIYNKEQKNLNRSQGKTAGIEQLSLF